MMNSHDMIRYMTFRMTDEVSHIPMETLRRDAEKTYRKSKKEFEKIFEEIVTGPKADELYNAAMSMTYAYGDLLGEKGIKMGMRFIAEQVFAPDDENKRPI